MSKTRAPSSKHWTKCEPYTEFDQPNPQSHYSRAKYQGELMLRDFLPRYYIVRAGWLFGGGKQDKKSAGRIIDVARTGDELMVVNDKFSSPSYTKDLSSGILRLVDTDQYGTYHMGNAGPGCSRYGVAQRILECAKIDSCRLAPCSSVHLPPRRPDRVRRQGATTVWN